MCLYTLTLKLYFDLHLNSGLWPLHVALTSHSLVAGIQSQRVQAIIVGRLFCSWVGSYQYLFSIDYARNILHWGPSLETNYCKIFLPLPLEVWMDHQNSGKKEQQPKTNKQTKRMRILLHVVSNEQECWESPLCEIVHVYPSRLLHLTCHLPVPSMLQQFTWFHHSILLHITHFHDPLICCWVCRLILNISYCTEWCNE